MRALANEHEPTRTRTAGALRQRDRVRPAASRGGKAQLSSEENATRGTTEVGAAVRSGPMLVLAKWDAIAQGKKPATAGTDHRFEVTDPSRRLPFLGDARGDAHGGRDRAIVNCRRTAPCGSDPCPGPAPDRVSPFPAARQELLLRRPPHRGRRR